MGIVGMVALNKNRSPTSELEYMEGLKTFFFYLNLKGAKSIWHSLIRHKLKNLYFKNKK